MTSSSGINLVEPALFVGMNRESIGGTLTLAKNCSLVFEFFTITARLRDKPEMYGNGCEGSTANGVSTGNIRSLNNFET